MIADKETDIVYFSDILQTRKEFSDSFELICSLLKKHRISYKLLTGTKDIWCRDYMPIQVEIDDFVQFRYEPSYLGDFPELKSDTNLTLKSNSIEAKFSNINLDGGNVVRSSDKAILTTRVFKENPHLSKDQLIPELEELLGVEVLFIPDLKTDVTGHADGHLRFIDQETVLVNELKNEFKYWKDGFLSMAKSANLSFVEMPWFEHRDKKYPETAVGGYVNYLEAGALILFPVFEVRGNRDMEALNVISSVFPDRKIEPININEIGKYGGLLNCISWTVKSVV